MISIQDTINGLFEFISGMFLWHSVYILFKDKTVKGVSIISTSVFSAWGMWNLYYYPFLGQWMSFLGGINIFTANIVWVFLAIKYTQKS